MNKHAHTNTDTFTGCIIKIHTHAIVLILLSIYDTYLNYN